MVSAAATATAAEVAAQKELSGGRVRVNLARGNQILQDARVRDVLDLPDEIPKGAIKNIYERHPLGHRDLSKTVGDIFNKWFTLEGGEENIREEILRLNERLRVQNKLHDAFKHGYLEGHSLIYKNFRDSASSPEEEVKGATTIESLFVIYAKDVVEMRKDKDLASERFGKLSWADVQISDPQSGGKMFRGKVSWTRLIHFANDPIFGSLEGLSYFSPSHDHYKYLKNTEWAASEGFHRNAAGTKLVNLGPEATEAEAKKMEEAMKLLDAAKEIIVPDGVTVTTVKPTPIPPQQYYDYLLKTVSAMPQTLLLGTQAGKVAGSETNLRIYFGDISAVQNNIVTPMLLDFYEQLQEFGLLPDGELPEIVWNPLLELSEKEKSDIWHKQAMASRILLGNELRGDPEILTVEEVRELIFGLEPEVPQAEREGLRINQVEIPQKVRLRFIELLNRVLDEAIDFFSSSLIRVNTAMKVETMKELRKRLKGKRLEKKGLRLFRDRIEPQEGREIADKVIEALTPEFKALDIAIREGFAEGILAGPRSLPTPPKKEALNQEGLPPALISWWEANSTQWSSELTSAQIAAIKKAIREGFEAGDSIGELELRLAQIFEATAVRYEVIARTEIIRSLTQGRLWEYRRLGVQRVVFMATPDERTSPTCWNLDGREFSLNASYGIIPVHPNCRCTFVARTDIEA